MTWISDEPVDRVDLTPGIGGDYYPIPGTLDPKTKKRPALSITAPVTGGAVIMLYLNLRYRLRAGYLWGYLTPSLLRVATDDGTAYDDRPVLRRKWKSGDPVAEMPAEDRTIITHTWMGEVTEGQVIRPEILIGGQFASLFTGPRYVKIGQLLK
jgi:hypothetical protein